MADTSDVVEGVLHLTDAVFTSRANSPGTRLSTHSLHHPVPILAVLATIISARTAILAPDERAEIKVSFVLSKNIVFYSR